MLEGVREIDYHGYSGCLALENGETRVVLGHHAGGRVLEYAHRGENALYLDPEQTGWTWREGEPPMHITGGRCDIGPEHGIPRHPALWLGAWTAEAIGPRETLAPGESASLTEEWWLLPFPFPASPEALDVPALVATVRAALDASGR